MESTLALASYFTCSTCITHGARPHAHQLADTQATSRIKQTPTLATKLTRHSITYCASRACSRSQACSRTTHITHEAHACSRQLLRTYDTYHTLSERPRSPASSHALPVLRVESMFTPTRYLTRYLACSTPISHAGNTLQLAHLHNTHHTWSVSSHSPATRMPLLASALTRTTHSTHGANAHARPQACTLDTHSTRREYPCPSASSNAQDPQHMESMLAPAS